MLKTEFIKALSRNLSVTKDQAKEIVEGFALTIKEGLADGKVLVGGIGKFTLSKYTRSFFINNGEPKENYEVKRVNFIASKNIK